MSRSIIYEAFEWTAKNRPEYLEAIEKRPSGSQWGGDGLIPWQELASLPWEQVRRENYAPGVHLNTCEYFYLNELDKFSPGATQAFKLLSDFEEYSTVKLQEGPHGWELVSQLVIPSPTTEAWLILGPAKNEAKETLANQKMVWSAFPGAITASIKHVEGFNGKIESLIKAANQGVAIAVKGLRK